MSLGAVCPHEYTEEDGLQLEIDCSECKGAHDLGNSKCLSAVIGALVDGAEPESIILKRFIHRRYRAKTVKMALAAASELAGLNRAISSTQPPSDRRCRTCPASREQLLVWMRRLLLEDPMGYVEGKLALRPTIQQHLRTIECERLPSCLTKALSPGTFRD